MVHESAERTSAGGRALARSRSGVAQRSRRKVLATGLSSFNSIPTRGTANLARQDHRHIALSPALEDRKKREAQPAGCASLPAALNAACRAREASG